MVVIHEVHAVGIYEIQLICILCIRLNNYEVQWA